MRGDADTAGEGGAGAEAVPWSTHRVVLLPDRVVKTYRPGHAAARAREVRALRLLAVHAPGIAPVLLEHGASRPGALTMSRLPGTPLRGRPLGAPELHAWAAALRTVHTALPPPELAAMPLRPGHQRAVTERLRRWYARPADRPRPPVVRRALDAGRAWLAGAPPGVTGDAPPSGVTPCFGPGDGNAANYLGDGHRVRLVDFEESGRSDRAWEIAEITEHVGGWVAEPVDVPALLRACALTPAETARLADCRRLLALVWLFLLAADDPARPRNPPGTAERQAHRLQVLLES
ncbi:translation initiation factor IF-2 [Streptomyces catenulae]|uniref:Aminoglycoside phosphotransferase family protein n=1 Tax=Streptomyces catenulae TaxID=66875 RepID=A0ABV2YSY8_9ACTN|nr:translation initiation factor IF-2 [Streptomyces catenulae]